MPTYAAPVGVDVGSVAATHCAFVYGCAQYERGRAGKLSDVATQVKQCTSAYNSLVSYLSYISQWCPMQWCPMQR